MTSVVGLDLSLTATGIATDDGVTRIRTRPDEFNNPEERRHHIAVLATDPNLIFSDTRRCLFVVEDVPTHAAHAIVPLAMLHGVVRNELDDWSHPFALMTPPALKKLATGKGNANKTEVVVAARDRLGYDGTDDNEADALWLREAGRQWLGISDVKLPKAHLTALEKVDWPEVGE